MNNQEMMELEFKPKTIAEPLDLEYLHDVEEEFGFEFEPAFVEFLQLHNGGVPLKQYFKLEENIKVLERFLCLVSDYEENFFGDYDMEVVRSQIDDRLNDYLIPFASVFAGDFLCFDYEENEENPEIVLWNHDESEELSPVTTPVAESFTEFLGMLSEDDKPEDTNSNNRRF